MFLQKRYAILRLQNCLMKNDLDLENMAKPDGKAFPGVGNTLVC
jgi:hypothetical protein